jgi:hypothetical protein
VGCTIIAWEIVVDAPSCQVAPSHCSACVFGSTDRRVYARWKPPKSSTNQPSATSRGTEAPELANVSSWCPNVTMRATNCVESTMPAGSVSLMPASVAPWRRYSVPGRWAMSR